MGSRRASLTGVLLALPLFISSAMACSCLTAPPCEEIGWSDLVFIGTVTEIRFKHRDLKQAWMHVDHAYKGALKETIELYDDEVCGGMHLEVGRQYLMYASGPPSGPVAMNGCSRSNRVEYAAEDLRFLKQYSAGRTTTHISGTVRFLPEEPEDRKLGERGRTPLKGVTVTVVSQGKKLSTTTNAIGKYSLQGLSPGKYAITADLVSYRPDWAPEITLRKNACAEADLFMKMDRRVQGVVRDDKGEAASDVLVEMMPANRQPARRQQPALWAVSHRDGEYVVDSVPPGNYYLGINIKSPPTFRYPYASTYYPNTTDIGKAIPIRVASGAPRPKFDLRVSSDLSLVDIQGRILNAQGKPPGVQDRPEVRIKQADRSGPIEHKFIKIDAEGRFHIELREGVAHSAFAISGGTYSAPVEFVPTQENNRLDLVLDKTQQEFLKLRDHAKD